MLDALRPLLCAESSGKIDLIDMGSLDADARGLFRHGNNGQTVGLNHVLAYSGH